MARCWFASAVLSSLLTLNIKLSHFVFCETKFVGKTDIQERKQDLEECPQVPNSRNERKSDEFFEEVKKLLALAGPLMLVNLLLYFLQVISLMFVGHLGELALSGASLATSFAFVTGYSLLVGMGSALETLCGQSYGALHHYMLGIHMQRAMFVSLLTLVSIPIVCIWANAGHILVILKQDPEIAAEAGLYARFMIPSIFAYGLLECQIRFLQAQNNVRPMMLSTGITLLLHVFSCWIFVLKTGLGSKGAALANATSYWINVFLLAAYVRISPSCKSTWTGFSTKAFTDIPRYLRLAIPSALMICLEIWSFELMVTLCGLLPNPKLETSVLSNQVSFVTNYHHMQHHVLYHISTSLTLLLYLISSLNTSAMLHMLAEGLGGATSVRVSNELGAGQPKAARLAARTATILATIEGILLAIIMVSIRNVWGHCYSNEEDVVIYVGKMLILHRWVPLPQQQQRPSIIPQVGFGEGNMYADLTPTRGAERLGPTSSMHINPYFQVCPKPLPRIYISNNATLIP
ncbi:protein DETOXIFICATION 16-like [Nicotiana tabacum]|uniref:Protein DETOXIFICATION 16-like n=1 Tax=Nicotiana tabacum TaxID=4097 RepID=A0AC58S098_TOBAC